MDLAADQTQILENLASNRLGLEICRQPREKGRRVQKRTGRLKTVEIRNAKDYWTKRVQRNIPANLQTSGFQLIKQEETAILKCKCRIQGYHPTYIEGGLFDDKLILHAHEQIQHLGTANTMAVIREEWWIPKLRSKVKKMINACNTCKV